MNVLDDVMTLMIAVAAASAAARAPRSPKDWEEVCLKSLYGITYGKQRNKTEEAKGTDLYARTKKEVTGAYFSKESTTAALASLEQKALLRKLRQDPPPGKKVRTVHGVPQYQYNYALTDLGRAAARRVLGLRPEGEEPPKPPAQKKKAKPKPAGLPNLLATASASTAAKGKGKGKGKGKAPAKAMPEVVWSDDEEEVDTKPPAKKKAKTAVSASASSSSAAAAAKGTGKGKASTKPPSTLDLLMSPSSK
jgi:hypothetical protein